MGGWLGKATGTRLRLALATSAVLALVAAAVVVAWRPWSHVTVVRSSLIAFHGGVPVPNTDSAPWEIFVVQPDGSHLRQLTFNVADENVQYENPRLSPDGTRIACDQGTNSGYAIWLMTTTGAGAHQLADDGVSPSFSPDGRRIVFVRWRESEIWVMDANGSHQRQLTPKLWGDLDVPSFSPDGKTIVFLRGSRGGPTAVWTMNADGSHRRRLVDVQRSGEFSGFADPSDRPSFSPDGKTILYGSEWGICEIGADRSHFRFLAGGADFGSPCFSPDGKHIVCVNRVQDDLWIADANGTHWHPLTLLHYVGDSAESPSWGRQAR